MTSLDEAWRWYDASKKQIQRMHRLAKKHWPDLPWEGGLGRDETFRMLEAEEVLTQATFALSQLDDLAIVVLFSAFEAIVRQRVADDVRVEAGNLRHASLRQAAREAVDAIEQGSFFRVTEPFKQADAGLVEEINQVRQYRNWVAHGKRGEQPAAVEPNVAHDRLQRFLAMIVRPLDGGDMPDERIVPHAQ